MTTLQRPILRYHGGKWKLAPWIISHFPKHRIYVEPYGGAASVLLRKRRTYAEVYNDIYSEVVNVFRVLRDQETAKELKRLIKLTPFSRDEFDLSYDPASNEVEQARRTIVRAFFGFGSGAAIDTHRTGFRSFARLQNASPAGDWMNYPGHVELFSRRLQGVVIENRDALQVMAAQDSPDTLHYVDPPYVLDTRSLSGEGVYHNEMNNSEHVELLQFLQGLKGMVVLSGYENEFYDDLLPDWFKYKREALADGAKKRVECLWINPACEAARGQLRLF